MECSELCHLLEGEVDMLIEKSHRSGLNYWQILRVFLRAVECLVMKADTEYWMKLR